MSALPDLDLARRFLAAHPPRGTVLLCGITGSHHYGFSSPDSDLDLKGIHLAETEAVLGLEPVPEVHERLLVFEGVECDLTTNEARKALKLLLGGNGNMLERIVTPFQVVDTPHVGPLRRLAEGARSRQFFRHYAGFFRGVCREHEKSPAPTAKSLLYAYRVALTGVHLLRTGEVVADLRENAPRYGFPEALDLIAFKVEAKEKAVVSAADDSRHRANWPKLDALLYEAKQASPLPEEAGNAAECSAWLVDVRRQALGR